MVSWCTFYASVYQFYCKLLDDRYCMCMFCVFLTAVVHCAALGNNLIKIQWVTDWISKEVCNSSQLRVQWHHGSSLKLAMVGLCVPQELGNATISVPSPPRKSRLLSIMDTAACRHRWVDSGLLFNSPEFCSEPWHMSAKGFWTSSYICSLPLFWTRIWLPVTNLTWILLSDCKISFEMGTTNTRVYHFDYTEKYKRDEKWKHKSPPPSRGLYCTGILMGETQTLTSCTIKLCGSQISVKCSGSEDYLC